MSVTRIRPRVGWPNVRRVGLNIELHFCCCVLLVLLVPFIFVVECELYFPIVVYY